MSKFTYSQADSSVKIQIGDMIDFLELVLTDAPACNHMFLQVETCYVCAAKIIHYELSPKVER